MQLSPGKFRASGAMLQLDGVSIARVSMERTLLQRGFAARGMFAVFIPGVGSGPIYAQGQLVETGQCATLMEGAQLEAISHEGYLDVCFGLDLAACRPQLEALTGGSISFARGACIAAPGPSWTNDILGRVDWLLTAVIEHPQCLDDHRLRASLTDHALAAMVRFDNSPADVDATTRSARAGRRVAVRLARDFIQSRLSEPLRLSELCRHANLKIRSLEYGFREVTGLTPVAYIRSLRLNAVRSALQQRRRGRSARSRKSPWTSVSGTSASLRRTIAGSLARRRRRHGVWRGVIRFFDSGAARANVDCGRCSPSMVKSNRYRACSPAGGWNLSS